MNKKYEGQKIFDALYDIENIKSKLRSNYPDFTFVSEKGDISEAFCIESYDLTKAPTGKSGFDATTKDGKTVSIKFLWEINKYRAISLSGGSNRKEYAYKDADLLLVLGRDEYTGKISTIFNGPLEFLEPYIKGGPVHPRIEVRNLKKIYPFVPKEQRLKVIKYPLPDATPIYYPKDLNQLFDIPSKYWSKFTMLWRNYECRHIKGLSLNDFFDYGIGIGEGDPLLSYKDIMFLKYCYDFYIKEYDHHTSAFAAYSKQNNIFFPDLVKVGTKNLKKLEIASSVVYAYRNDAFIRKHFSYFFNMKHKGPGGRILQRYLTPHDIAIFNRAYEIRGRINRFTKGGNTDNVHFIRAGRLAAEEVGLAPIFQMPDPRV